MPSVAELLAVWFEWVENIPYFPTVLAFCAATFAYVIDPSLANDKVYLVIAMLTIFWRSRWPTSSA